MKKGLVSVILPNYNGAKYLKQSIESVLKQTYSNLELILIDDASTDDSSSIISGFSDERIRVIKMPENGQICKALNKGLEQAQGEYIGRIDSDDVWKQNKLEKQIEFMDKHKDIGACFSYVNLIDEKGNCANGRYEELYKLFQPQFKTQKEWIQFFVFSGNCLSHPSALIRKSVIDEVGNYNLAFVQGQDYELWMRIVLKYNLYVYPETLVKYRWTPELKDNISSNTEDNNTRFYNENLLAVYRLFQRITNQEFIEYFQDMFVNRDAYNDLELMCEKAFLCLRHDNTGKLSPIGMAFLEKVFNTQNGEKILREKYRFSIHDYYKLNKRHLFNDTILQSIHKQEIDRLQQELSEQKVIVENQIRAAYENTKSWKITAPIRKMGHQYKKIKKVMKPSPKLYLLGTEDYGNLGDHAIALAEIEFLKKNFPQKDIVEVPASQYFAKRDELKNMITDKDIIFGTGGGNLGNQYPIAEEIRRDIIKTYLNNKIIIFPQTIYFLPGTDGERELRETRKIYNAHKNLNLFVRDRSSYELAKSIFECKVELIPDIVLFLNACRKRERSKQIVVCLRKDIEQNLSKEERIAIDETCKKLTDNIFYTDTQKNYNITIEERKKAVKEFLEKFSSARLVVTDRMHGMIFAAITGTPCVVMNNYNHKIKETYSWIQNLKYIKYIDEKTDLEKAIQDMYAFEMDERQYWNNVQLMKYYAKLVEAIKKK